MSRQSSQLLTTAALSTLLSPVAEAVTVGGIIWVPIRATGKEGTVRVRTTLSTLAPCRLRIVINTLVPSEPRMQYLAGAGRETFSARRLCLNIPHRPFDGTHKHRTEPRSADESAYEPDDIPEVPLAPRVAPGACRAVLEAFARECFIEIGPDFVWTEP
ncbi:hypothetical protein [Protofrankia coriariae]|uniref:hypothetical protein n=1 Tax=Protofrankia coriariae TaxID=1562887 RepID=UPI0012F65594|nr:hypothetical protein [Protofrankia coriariae]